MDKQTTAQPYPWYDDRVEAVRKEYVDPWAEAEESAEEPTWYTPREIYNYLDGKVWKQDGAKRAVSVIKKSCWRTSPGGTAFPVSGIILMTVFLELALLG